MINCREIGRYEEGIYMMKFNEIFTMRESSA